MNLKEDINELLENQDDFYLDSKRNNNILDMEMDISLNEKNEEKEFEPKKKKMFAGKSKDTKEKVDDFEDIQNAKIKILNPSSFDHFK
jgi:hypothetical protein